MLYFFVYLFSRFFDCGGWFVWMFFFFCLSFLVWGASICLFCVFFFRLGMGVDWLRCGLRFVFLTRVFGDVNVCLFGIESLSFLWAF